VQVAGVASVTPPVPPVWEKLAFSPETAPAQPETLTVQDEERPTSNWFAPSALGGVQETEVVVVAWVTVTLAVPELAALAASPGYDAWMVTGPGEPPVTVTEQLFPDSAHVAGEENETLPDPPVWENATVSPSLVVPAPPDTLAVHWEVAPTAKEAGAHETEVLAGELGKYWKVVVPIAVAPYPAHVAFTRYVPAIQQGLPPQEMPPPATVSWLKLPVTALTGSLSMSTAAWLGFETTTMTAVFGPGAGNTVPVIAICAIPTYEDWLVCTMTV